MPRYGNGLNEPGGRIRLHLLNELDERGPAHDAICIQHDHKVVTPAPPLAEVGYVSGLTTGVGKPTTVVELGGMVPLLAQRPPGRLLRQGNGGVGGIAEQIDIEAITVTRARQRLNGGGQAAHDPGRVFVTDGHDHGCAPP